MREAFLLDTFLGVISIVALPKCGSQTIAKYSMGTIAEGSTQQFPLRLAFVREPFDRFLSAFHFFAGTGYKITRQKIETYEQFVDESLLSDDDHVRSQSMLLESTMVNKLVCLDSMSDVLGRLTGHTITVENPAIRADIDTGYRKDEVMRRYRDDVKLYADSLNSKAV